MPSCKTERVSRKRRSFSGVSCSHDRVGDSQRPSGPNCAARSRRDGSSSAASRPEKGTLRASCSARDLARFIRIRKSQTLKLLRCSNRSRPPRTASQVSYATSSAEAAVRTKDCARRTSRLWYRATSAENACSSPALTSGSRSPSADTDRGGAGRRGPWLTAGCLWPVASDGAAWERTWSLLPGCPDKAAPHPPHEGRSCAAPESVPAS